jgi:catechol 2,3-dioxygenase-like lactoylglutathione lyase family enzyme
MKKVLIGGLSAIGALIAIVARAQGPAEAPSPRPMIGATIPVVDDLAKCIHFYHELLGLQGRDGDPRANLGWYPSVPILDDMYGAVGGQLRNVALLIPGSELRVEADEWQNAKGKALNPRLQDSGASRLILRVRNLDQLTGYLKQGGAKVVTTGGAPVTVTEGGVTSRATIFEDGSGFFVELVEPATPPAPGRGNGPRQFIYGGDITVTVADLDKSARFLHEVFGVEVKPDASARADVEHLQLFGMKSAQFREADVTWPDKTPQLRLIQFTGIDQKTLMPLVADPDANLIRVFVRDMDTTLEKIKAFPDAKIMNVSGGPIKLGNFPFLVVRLPGASTYLQIGAVPTGRIG